MEQAYTQYNIAYKSYQTQTGLDAGQKTTTGGILDNDFASKALSTASLLSCMQRSLYTRNCSPHHLQVRNTRFLLSLSVLSDVFGAVDKTSYSFSAHGKIGNFIVIIITRVATTPRSLLEIHLEGSKSKITDFDVKYVENGKSYDVGPNEHDFRSHVVGCVAQWAERRSLAGELTLSCARPAADG